MKIEEVLQIKEQMLGDYSVQAVSGRALHKALESAEDYPKWIRCQLKRLKMVFGVDYTEVRTAVEGGAVNGRIGTDHIIPIDTAKTIAMMAKTESGDKVRTYFLACEKTVQSHAQQLLTNNPVVDKFIADVNYASWFAKSLNLESGKVQKYAIEEGTKIEQQTGIKVLVPQLLQDTGLLIDFNAPVGTLAHAAEVGIGTTFTNASKWALDMYGKKSYSTLINNTLIELGYAVRMKNLKIASTNLGSQFANDAPIATSCHNKLTDTPMVYGWNLADKRFTDVVFPVIQHKINIGLKK